MPAAASLPDYYALLGVAPNAGADVIRKAYRAQARKYHPDAAPDNPFAPAQFRALKDAYEVLSHPQKRQHYDEERWLRGFSGRPVKTITAETLVQDAGRLQRHLKTIGRSAVQPRALQQLLLYLLQDAYLALFVASGNEALSALFGEAVLASANYLPYRFWPPVAVHLQQLQPLPETFRNKLSTALATRLRQHQWERRLPWLVALFTLLLCGLMAVGFRK